MLTGDHPCCGSYPGLTCGDKSRDRTVPSPARPEGHPIRRRPVMEARFPGDLAHPTVADPHQYDGLASHGGHFT